MAIYIVDNGASYSEHGIYFIDSCDYKEEDIKSIINATNYNQFDKEKIIAKSDKFEWWGGVAQKIYHLFSKRRPTVLAVG